MPAAALRTAGAGARTAAANQPSAPRTRTFAGPASTTGRSGRERMSFIPRGLAATSCALLRSRAAHSAIHSCNAHPPFRSTHLLGGRTVPSARGVAGEQPGMRRLMSATASASSSGESESGGLKSDLKDLPGVGPKTEQLLRKSGIRTLDDLQEMYVTEHKRDRDAMVGYLKENVGIIHQKRTEGIVDKIEEMVGGEGGEQSKRRAQERRITFCIEGNISVGKTTFLQRIAAEVPELQELVEVVPEPVEKWQNIERTSGDVLEPNLAANPNFNILEAFYENPDRYAYTFQNYVFVTRMMQEQESRGTVDSAPLRLMERSVFSDRMVFVRAVHEAHWLSDMEISIYDSWFDPVLSQIPALVPDGFIYLRAKPGTCHERLLKRARSEEKTVTLEYLEGLHQKHEDWLGSAVPATKWLHAAATAATPKEMFASAGGVGGAGAVLSPQGPHAPGNASETVPIPEELEDHVFFLMGEGVHPGIQGAPALLLDCDRHIDMSLDIDTKRWYAHKVRSFFDWAKARKRANQTAGGVIRPPPGFGASHMTGMAAFEAVQKQAGGMGGGVTLSGSL